MIRTEYTALKPYFYKGRDHKNLNIPNTLLKDAARLRNDSSFNFSSPYDFELPMTKRPKRTVMRFNENIVINYLVLSRSRSDDSSMAWSLSCSIIIDALLLIFSRLVLLD